MKCPKCGREFQGDLCPACGYRAATNERCPVCGRPHAAGERFCPQCGFDYAAPRYAPPQGYVQGAGLPAPQAAPQAAPLAPSVPQTVIKTDKRGGPVLPDILLPLDGSRFIFAELICVIMAAIFTSFSFSTSGFLKPTTQDLLFCFVACLLADILLNVVSFLVYKPEIFKKMMRQPSLAKSGKSYRYRMYRTGAIVAGFCGLFFVVYMLGIDFFIELTVYERSTIAEAMSFVFGDITLFQWFAWLLLALIPLVLAIVYCVLWSKNKNASCWRISGKNALLPDRKLLSLTDRCTRHLSITAPHGNSIGRSPAASGARCRVLFCRGLKCLQSSGRIPR